MKSKENLEPSALATAGIDPAPFRLEGRRTNHLAKKKSDFDHPLSSYIHTYLAHKSDTAYHKFNLWRPRPRSNSGLKGIWGRAEA